MHKYRSNEPQASWKLCMVVKRCRATTAQKHPTRVERRAPPKRNEKIKVERFGKAFRLQPVTAHCPGPQPHCEIPDLLAAVSGGVLTLSCRHMRGNSCPC